MAFELFCMTIIALLFSAALIFGGYRFFLFLLPIWGFFFGFMLGASAIQALFSTGMLATVTSWVVGFIVALIFAALSYFFYAAAVAVAAAVLGYMLGVGIMDLFGLNGLSLLTFLVAVALAVIVIIVTFRYNLQKYVIIAATSIGGAALAVGTILMGIGGVNWLQIAESPVRLLWQTSPFMAIVFALLAIAGIVVQIRANRRFEIQTYNRLADTM
ncbi:MAG: DUF4203 domain-containing protein [Anaerolineae bacterium]|nr:DUF4203 domain-containing protein [Anaerolineae bacterium]